MLVQGIKSSLIASVLSRGWSAALALALVPFAIRYLGVEAYGIVGVFASISAAVVFLDLGLGPTLVRILNRPDIDGMSKTAHRDALRTFELTYACVAIALLVIVAALAIPISLYWIRVNEITTETAAAAIAISGLALATQWPSSLYSAGLTALNKQTQLAILTSGTSTIKFVITITALHHSPTLYAFFFAQIVSNAAQTAVLRTALWSALKKTDHQARFDSQILRDSIGFAGGMTGITLTSIALTQADRFVLSKALDLKVFGAYVLAATLASGMYIIISPIYSVMYPRLSAAWQSNNKSDLAKLYHYGAEIIAITTIPLAVTGAMYAANLLNLWTQDDSIGEAAGLTLAALLIGNMFNGIMNMPYALQVAAGWTRLTLLINLGSIALIIPLLWLASIQYGMVGAACAWLGLNFVHLIITPSLVHRYILRGEMKRWYWAGVLRPAFTTVAVMLAIISLNNAAGLHLPWIIESVLVWISITLAIAGSSESVRVALMKRLSSVEPRY
ncbi:lipopolysaccharide biosynthesis protein [Hydrogenophaga sp. IBVHS2]|uniref:lipopolysaccharide biosynthesis protein n=1 Tax=Hydrogenophaga sp. IBVHS2 TaxID=1985170 RepID=UPI0015C51C52|nr:MATE family efflux transporter [Hydrogenophaga sp. IBVHS2]